MLVAVILSMSLFGISFGLDNGLARTPPMGWLAWERFRCNVDCVNDPENCISEKLFMSMADRVAADGYKDAGYSYVNIDDCWLAKERDASGKLVPDPQRFPSGIKALAAYVHGKGLKLGIYEDFGTKTCAGYPGSQYHLEIDAQTFADWDVDMLKLDGCNSDPHDYDDAYPAMGFWLNKTGRPIMYSCSWPAYQEGSSIKPNYTRLSKSCNIARNFNDVQDSWDSVIGIIEFYGNDAGNFSAVTGPGFFNDPDMPDYARIAKYCNIWRNYDDIQDSWESLTTIIKFYGDDKTNFTAVAAPGSFNDPDMLIIGGYGLSYDQQRVQMAMWSILAAPLMISADLRNIRPESKEILLNKFAIAVNQDPMGKQGTRIKEIGNVQVWTRPIMPQGSIAFAFLNTDTGGMPNKVSVKLSDLGLTSAGGYTMTEVFDNKAMGNLKPTDTFVVPVNPTGIFFGKATPVGSQPRKGSPVLRFKPRN